MDEPARPLHSGLFARTAIWTGLLLALLQVLAGGWVYFQAQDMVWRAQEQAAAAQAHGLANAVGDALVLKDYAGMEARLRQTMASDEIRSALVADASGRALVYLRRSPGGGEALLVFDAPNRLPAADGEAAALQTRVGGQIASWERVGVGVTLGWVMIESLTGAAEAAVSELRFRTGLLAALGVLVGVAMLSLILGRASQQLRSRELRWQADHRVLQRMAFHDALTGLPNRHLLLDRLRQAMARCDRQQELLAIAYLDIDGFKLVNDRYGHEVGDQLLIEVARRLGASVRAEDTVARLGGDEFVLLLVDVQGVAACDVMLQRVLDALCQPVTIMEQVIPVVASMGVTFYPLDEGEASTLLDHADQAMYESKRARQPGWRLYGLSEPMDRPCLPDACATR